MKRSVFTGVFGFLTGVIIISLAAFTLMPRLMLLEYESKLDLNDTVENIFENSRSHGWSVKQSYLMHKGAEKIGIHINPVVVIEIGHSGHSSHILEHDRFRATSVMMPARIAVYEKQDHKVYIALLNLELMGKMFGDVVAEVMDEAQVEHNSIISDLIR